MLMLTFSTPIQRIQVNNLSTGMRCSHCSTAMKPLRANLRAVAATSAAAQLEEAATSGNAAEIPELAKKLTTEVRRTIEYLRLKAA